MGKPATTADASTGTFPYAWYLLVLISITRSSSGYIDPATLATCVAQAKNAGWVCHTVHFHPTRGLSAEYS